MQAGRKQQREAEHVTRVPRDYCYSWAGVRGQASFPLRLSVCELRHCVLEDMEIQCRAAEPKANRQRLALRR